MSKFNPPVFEYESEEYEGYITRLNDANRAQNERSRYKRAIAAGKPNPFGETIPPKPTSVQLKVIKDDRDWKHQLTDKSDHWWIRRIKKNVEEKFYQAKVAYTIWWEICNKRDTKHHHHLSEQKINVDPWEPLFEHYDEDLALSTDYSLVEYALHCCGLPPAKARELVAGQGER